MARPIHGQPGYGAGDSDSEEKMDGSNTPGVLSATGDQRCLPGEKLFQSEERQGKTLQFLKDYGLNTKNAPEW